MKINQLKAGVMLSYISEAVSVLIGLVYTPIMLRLLGKSEYGLYQLASSVISYLSVLSFGFVSSYVRYYSKYKVKNDTNSIAKLNGMFMTIFTVIGIICILAGSVLVVNVNNIFKVSLSPNEITTCKILMSLMIFNLAITFPGSVFTSHINANEQYVFQQIILILRNILNPFLTIPLLLMGYKSIAVVVVQTILSVFLFVSNMVFCKKKLKMSFNFKGFEFTFLKELFMFSFWIFLNQIVDQVNWNLDKFILGLYSGTISVAIYGVASQLNNLYLTFSASIANVFIPKINRIVAKSDDNKLLTQLFTKVARIQFMVVALIVSGLIIFGNYFITIWVGEGYEETYKVALILIISAVVPSIQHLGIAVQRAKNMHQYRAIIYISMSVANVLISIPLAKLYGATGAAIGTAFSLIIGNGLIMNIFYHKKIGLDMIFFWKEILKFIPSLIAPIILGFFIMKYITFTNIVFFILTIIIYTLVYCISIYTFGMNKAEKELVLQPLRKIAGNKND